MFSKHCQVFWKQILIRSLFKNAIKFKLSNDDSCWTLTCEKLAYNWENSSVIKFKSMFVERDRLVIPDVNKNDVIQGAG